MPIQRLRRPSHVRCSSDASEAESAEREADVSAVGKTVNDPRGYDATTAMGRYLARQHGSVLDRFWACVEKTETCWLWTGLKNNWGYGRFYCREISPRDTRPAHRVSFHLLRRPLAPGELVLHKCDVPACVNPDHLFIGTNADNNRDMHDKGRSWQRKKTHCPSGHAYDDKNTIFKYNRRYCRACKNARMRRARQNAHI